MNADDAYPLWLQVAALTVILAPTLLLLSLRRRIGLMNTASALVIWGALAACSEHGMWAMRLAIHERAWSNPHSTVHYFMAGAYTAIAGFLLSVIALTLLRERRRSGWFAVLVAVVVGGSLELVMNGPTGRLYHHIGLYGYVAAWLAALVLAYKPIFRGATTPPAPTLRRQLKPHASR
jgi:FtsH-binding integral membrane protein